MDKITLYGNETTELNETVEFLQQRNVQVEVHTEQEYNAMCISRDKHLAMQKKDANYKGKGKGKENVSSNVETNYKGKGKGKENVPSDVDKHLTMQNNEANYKGKGKEKENVPFNVDWEEMARELGRVNKRNLLKWGFKQEIIVVVPNWPSYIRISLQTFKNVMERIYSGHDAFMPDY